MRELLKELHRIGKTILISSHILLELADLCNKFGVVEGVHTRPHFLASVVHCVDDRPVRGSPK